MSKPVDIASKVPYREPVDPLKFGKVEIREPKRIKYPDDWMGEASLAQIINYAELSKFAKVNGLDYGNMTYLVDQLQMNAKYNVDRMINNPDGK